MTKCRIQLKEIAPFIFKAEYRPPEPSSDATLVKKWPSFEYSAIAVTFPFSLTY